MSSFQAKIGWKRQRWEKIKIIVPFRSNPKGQRKFQKNRIKIKKIKKYDYGLILSQNRLEEAEKGENKNYRSVSFLHDPKQKIIKKKQKN